MTLTFPYVLSQHNCVSDYIPFLDAFEITQKVVVGDGQVEIPCQGATRGESSRVLPNDYDKECNYYTLIGNEQT